MSILNIKTRDNQANYIPGEILEGVISWQLDGVIEALELRLIWFTSGKGDTDVSVENTQRFNAPSLSGDSAFRFVLPTAPHSFSGQLISLTWALELVAIPGEESERCEFSLAPDGHEIMLPKVENPDLEKIPKWLKNKLQKHSNGALENIVAQSTLIQSNTIQDDVFTSTTSSSAHDATDKPFSS